MYLNKVKKCIFNKKITKISQKPKVVIPNEFEVFFYLELGGSVVLALKGNKISP